jgi:hypothetical protein
MNYVKLSVSVDSEIYKLLAEEAERRRVMIQELVRAVVLPEWIAHAKPVEKVQIDG